MQNGIQRDIIPIFNLPNALDLQILAQTHFSIFQLEDSYFFPYRGILYILKNNMITNLATHMQIWIWDHN